MIDARTKTMAFVLPCLALFLAFLLKEEAWIDRSPKRTWREVMHPETVPGWQPEVASADADTAPAEDGEGDPAADGAADAPTPPGDRPDEPSADPDPTPAEPADEAPAAIDFKIKAPPEHRGALPLTVPASERLDITVSPAGAPLIKGRFLDPDTAASMMASDDRKSTGLAFIIASERVPWSPVGDILNAASAAGWTRVALAVDTPDRPGLAAVLRIDFPPPGEPVEEDVPVTVVTVKTVSGQPRYILDGTTHTTREDLEAAVKELHDEYEIFVNEYSAKVDTTPWVIDGEEGDARGVVQAWDALSAAGVKTVRLKGVHRPE